MNLPAYKVFLQIMLKEVILKSNALALDIRDSSIVSVFIPNKDAAFVYVVTLLKILERLYYRDNTDLSAV